MPDHSHSPAPWQIEVGSGDYLAINDGEDRTVCTIDTDREWPYNDANLIRMAPELLESLEGAVQLLETPATARELDIYLDTFRNVIAEAKGRPRLAE
jgi:hypothetical protein